MSELNRSEMAEAAERIDRCEHQWVPAGAGEVRCTAGCEAVLSGSLAAEPPAVGMDWDRNVLVRRDAVTKDSAQVEVEQNGRARNEAEPFEEAAEAGRAEQEAGQEVER